MDINRNCLSYLSVKQAKRIDWKKDVMQCLISTVHQQIHSEKINLIRLTI